MNDLTTTQNGHPIIWAGHLCEGNLMVQGDPGTLATLLWTRCKNHDVPANKGKEGEYQDVTCPDCKAFIPMTGPQVLGLDVIDLTLFGEVSKHVEDTINDRVILIFVNGAVLDIPSRLYINLDFAPPPPQEDT